MQFKPAATLVFFLTLLCWASVANADWRSEIGVFRIGIVSGDQPAAMTDRAEPFRLAVSEALDMDVEFFPGKNPRVLMDALASGRIEYAVLSAFAYALVSTACECVEPLVSPRATDSTDGYHLVLIARSGGPGNPAAFANKTIGLLSPAASAETALLKKALEKEGLDVAKVRFETGAGGEEVLEAFAAGSLDALAGWSSMTGNPSEGYSRGTMRQLLERQPDGAGRYQVIWQSVQIPHRAHVIRKMLPGEAKNTLRNLLNALYDRNPAAYDAIEPVYGGGFVTTRHSRFEPLLEVAAGLDQADEEAGEADREKENPPQ